MEYSLKHLNPGIFFRHVIHQSASRALYLLQIHDTWTRSSHGKKPHPASCCGLSRNAPYIRIFFNLRDVGSLCENCDKFAVQRPLPKIQNGDLVIIHDAGAHGRAMGFNYNGKLRAGEILMRCDGSFKEIRRRETVQDLFATLDLDGVKDFK